MCGWGVGGSLRKNVSMGAQESTTQAPGLGNLTDSNIPCVLYCPHVTMVSILEYTLFFSNLFYIILFYLRTAGE